jgi:hypothetical protein
VTHNDVPHFVRNGKPLSVPVMVVVHANEFMLRAEQPGKGVRRRLDAHNLEAEFACDFLDVNRRGERTVIPQCTLR